MRGFLFWRTSAHSSITIVAGFAFKKSEERQKKNIILQRSMKSKMVHHVSVKEDVKYLSMLMRILPTKITATITVGLGGSIRTLHDLAWSKVTKVR